MSDVTWSLHGVSRKDPLRVSSVEEAIALVNELGFLPCFRNAVSGFSLEERTCAEDWWTGNEDADPWEWRRLIAESGKAAYGKFFSGKAGFISLEYLPLFIAFRRDCTDFDVRWEEGEAAWREKRIMDCFEQRPEWFACDLKAAAGFGKDGEKNFSGVMTGLEMKTYLCIRDFRQRLSKQMRPFGWHVSVYSTPEEIFGEETVRSAYGLGTDAARERVMTRLEELYPRSTEEERRKLLL